MIISIILIQVSMNTLAKFSLTLIALTLGNVSAFNMMNQPNVEISPERQAELDANRPLIEFPDSFMMSISTNDPGLNLTEVILYVSAPEI